MPSIFSVSGSPITSSGTFTTTLVTQSANNFLAGPTTGGAATPSFRPIVIGDISSALNYKMVTSVGSNSDTLSSTTPTVIAGMTISTPAAGTYFVTFNVDAIVDNVSCGFYFAIYNGVTQVSYSQKRYTLQTNGSLSSQAVLVMNGSDSITLQWYRYLGSCTATATYYSLFAIRVA
jgi:hypothetical protein